MRFILPATVLCLAAFSAQARPITYPGGWTVMAMNDPGMNALHLFYTPQAGYSIGLVHEYMHAPDAHLEAVQGNYLVKRWNMPDSQGNFYINGGLGTAHQSGAFDPAFYGGISADWEDRRLYTSYENRFLWADETDKFAKHTARIGIAPYIGDYGDIHTWLMLQADYDSGENDKTSVTPLVRLFKGTTLIEAGYNLNGGVLFNAMITF